jgi:ATP-dependent DNA helicase RecG
MYSLATPLDTVKGIGPKLWEALQARHLHTVKDALLLVPLRYEDRSTRKMIYQLEVGELVTIEAEVTSTSNFYKGRRSIQSASLKDHTGKLKAMWFNNPHIVKNLVKGETYAFSGKLNDRKIFLQPTVEKLNHEAIHTGRLVPVYSVIPDVPPTTWRKLLKQMLDLLDPIDDPLLVGQEEIVGRKFLDLKSALLQIHFPDTHELAVEARERFALEELVTLIQHSQALKATWQERGGAETIAMATTQPQLPFTLTNAQERCTKEILSDLQSQTPMNRLLLGDVGAGKTAVAGLAIHQVLEASYHAAFVAPTQILVDQHAATLQKLFPQFTVQLVTSKIKPKFPVEKPTLFLGTHAVLNQLNEIKPSLIVYDEQHRFGVGHRSIAQDLKPAPHILTLTATPIPRTLMLSIFSHLGLSVIDELPPGRLPIKTWIVPKTKREAGLKWIGDQITIYKKANPGKTLQTIFVCPFIDPSRAEALENVAAATQKFDEVKKALKGLRVELLHGRMKKTEQSKITAELFAQKIDVLVTTPIVEVGVDLPAATIIVIEAAERFGLASLHQLRGRVGRAGQQGYCLLFTANEKREQDERLQLFCQTHKGLELAEQDLARRGAGDLFGTQQHGFDNLQFATWSNLELITSAKQLAEALAKDQKRNWQPILQPRFDEEFVPLAN